jgi:hypothetical protein
MNDKEPQIGTGRLKDANTGKGREDGTQPQRDARGAGEPARKEDRREVSGGERGAMPVDRFEKVTALRDFVAQGPRRGPHVRFIEPLIAYITAHPGLGAPQLTERSGTYSASKMRKALHDLAKAGRLVRSGTNESGYTYAVPTKGLPAKRGTAVAMHVAARERVKKLDAAAPSGQTKRAKLVEYVRTHPGVTAKDIATALGRPRNVVLSELSTLAGAGRLRYGEGKPPRPIFATDGAKASAPAAPATPTRPTSNRDRVVEFVLANPGLTVKEIQKSLPDAGSIRSAVQALVDLRRLRYQGKKPQLVFVADAPAPEKRPRKNGVKNGALRNGAAAEQPMSMAEFERFCAASGIELEQALALAYKLVVRQLVAQSQG